MNFSAAPVVLFCALGIAACVEHPPAPAQRVSFRVFGDPNKPLAGANLLQMGNTVATSDESGVALVTLRGQDGDSFEIALECPTGFKSPPDPTVVTLRRLASADQVPEYRVSCPPTVRSVVVAVKGARGYALPVLALGREIGRTDPFGVATVLLQVSPQEQFDLELDTSDVQNAALRPQNPVATFTVKNRDEVFVFDPHFVVANQPPSRAVRRTRRDPAFPVRIQ